MGALEELVAKAGGCAVIDGGFATQLEALGADINDPLWSAACLITRPHLVKEVTALPCPNPGPTPRPSAGMCTFITVPGAKPTLFYYWFITLQTWELRCNATPNRCHLCFCFAAAREK